MARSDIELRQWLRNTPKADRLDQMNADSSLVDDIRQRVVSYSSDVLERDVVSRDEQKAFRALLGEFDA